MLVAPAWAQEQRVALRAAEPSKGGFVLPERAERPPPSAEAFDTLKMVNAYRAAGATCGTQRMDSAPPLVWSQQLEQAAIKHSQDMAARRDMSHSGGDGSRMRDRVARESYAWSNLGENVSAGYASIPAGLAGWMKSPGHCANLMGTQFREVGVGAAHASGDVYGWYRTMVLGNPSR